MSSVILKFQHPSTIMIAGPTQAGKTWFVKRVIKEKMIEPQPTRIVWIYKETGDKKEFEKLQTDFTQVEFLNQIQPELLDNIVSNDNNLVILDDVMSEAAESKSVAQMFTQGCHLPNMSVIFLVQNLFFQGKQMRTISLNTHYIVLYKNPRDKSQCRTLAYQMFPNNAKFLIDAYEHATEQPHTYLLIDLHSLTKEEHRIR